MIIRLIGNVKFPLTLDPTVWIFDDRKIPLEEAFTPKQAVKQEKTEEWKKTSEAWDREVYQQKVKPPVNKSISRMEGKKILEGTFVMPIKDFIQTSEPGQDAMHAILHRENKESYQISYQELENSLLLFAQNGKPVQEEGPVHLYFQDGSNKAQPLKGIFKIEIK